MIRNYTTNFIKIALIIGVVVGLFVATSNTQAIGPTFATGSGAKGVELKIDSSTYYNGILQPRLSWELKNLRPWRDKFFFFKDVKPGDTGMNTISIHVKKNPAFVCLDFQNLRDRENGRNEPEREIDSDYSGELSQELEFFAWRDDGDNLFEVGEEPLFGTSTQSAKDVLKGKSYALADSQHGTPYQPNQTNYIGINWCAGDLVVDTSTATLTCGAEAMGNEAQTDSMTLGVSLRAVAAKQQPWFSCVKKTRPPHSGGGHWNDDNEDKDDNHHDDNEDKDDNHHDDDYDSRWHHVAKKSSWQSFKNYCVSAWNKGKNKFRT